MVFTVKRMSQDAIDLLAFKLLAISNTNTAMRISEVGVKLSPPDNVGSPKFCVIIYLQKIFNI